MPIEKSTARDSHPIHKAVVDPPRPPQPLHEKLICRMHQASDGRQTLISRPAFAQYPAARIGQTDLLAPARTGSGIGQALRLHALLKSLCQVRDISRCAAKDCKRRHPLCVANQLACSFFLFRPLGRSDNYTEGLLSPQIPRSTTGGCLAIISWPNLHAEVPDFIL